MLIDQFPRVQEALQAAGLTPVNADVVMRPENRSAVPEEVLESFLDMLDRLEDLDDVQDIYHNAIDLAGNQLVAGEVRWHENRRRAQPFGPHRGHGRADAEASRLVAGGTHH